MRKLLTLLTLTTLVSCGQLDTWQEGKITPQKNEQDPVPTTENYSAKSIEYITGSLKTTGPAIGLYKITLQDGREILLYNDSKGIAMIQLFNTPGTGL